MTPYKCAFIFMIFTYFHIIICVYTNYIHNAATPTSHMINENSVYIIIIIILYIPHMSHTALIYT